MFKYIMLLFLLILFIINEITKTKKLEYTKNNLILKGILEVAYNSQLVEEAGIKIIKILNTHFDFDYCTLYRYNKKRNSLDIICSTDNYLNMGDLTDMGNRLLDINKDKADAYIETSNFPLNYKSTINRNIKYIYFIPLKTSNTIIGALLIERVNLYNKKEKKAFETDFFKIVTETITLALQNLIYFEQITNSAYLDGLTGAYNRKYMDIYLSEKIKIYSNNHIPFAITMFDIDHFKNFNDTYGHQFGDLVLKELCKFVEKNIRETDILFRYGGEEFIIFMPNINEITVSNRIDNIRKSISKLIIIDEKGISAQITCSFGVVTFPNNKGIVEELINKADQALYNSKNNGRNRTTIYRKATF